MHRPMLCALLIALVANPAFAATPAAVPQEHARVAAQMARLPLAFEPNQGQAPNGADFLARGAGYTILLHARGADLALRARDRAKVIHLNLLNSAETRAAGTEPLATRVNYLRGKDPKKWFTNLPTYERVNYAGVYPRTDLVYYGNQGKLEYDFNVAPGGDPSRIGFEIAGVESVHLLANGDLALTVKAGDVVWHKPVAYQVIAGKRVPVKAGYRVDGKRVSFRVGRYDKGRELVIDPALAYSTLFGGSSDDHADAIAVDGSGNAYITGQTRSANMPTTTGAYDRVCGTATNCDDSGDGPQADAFVMKLNPTGTRVVYATFFGGNDYDEAFAIAVDGGGNAYIGGETFSTDFPTTTQIGGGTLGAFGMAFVAKLNSTGSSLVYSAIFSGANTDNGSAVTGLKVDGSGNAYAGGITEASDFPVTAGAFQTTYGGAPSGTGGDAFVAKLNASGTAFVWASYLGGNLRDTAEDLAIDSSGNVYVTGWTSSADFPVTAGAYLTSIPSVTTTVPPTSSFVTKVNAGGASLAYSTYFGGSDWDIAYGLAVANGNAYITGVAQSSNFPTTTGAIQRTMKGISDSFVTKFNSTGTGLVYSTLLGGTSDERGSGIAVNSSGIAYVTGVTYSSDFPTNSYGFQQVFGGNEDVYVTQLNATGTGFAFSSFLGGSYYENDQAKSRIALLGSNAFVSGSTASSDFPVTPDAAQKTNGGNFAFDAFVARIVPLCALNHTIPSVTICSPASGSTTHSPVTVVAGSWDSRKVRLLQVYVDGKKVYEAKLASLDVRLTMSAGTHRVTVQGIDTANTVFKSTRYITVD